MKSTRNTLNLPLYQFFGDPGLNNSLNLSDIKSISLNWFSAWVISGNCKLLVWLIWDEIKVKMSLRKYLSIDGHCS